MNDPTTLERRIVTLPNGDVRYCVLGPRLAVDFHVHDAHGDVTAGLEMHYSVCPSYLAGQRPFSESCWLTGTRCFGDGTSLYATEWLYPQWKEMGIEAFWPVLEGEWRRRERDAFAEVLS